MSKSFYNLPEESKLLGPNFPDTPAEEVDQHIQFVTSNYDSWVKISENQRGQILARCLTTSLQAIEASSDTFDKYRGWGSLDEARTSWLPVILTIRHYVENLQQYSGKQPPLKRYKNINGKIVDQVLFDRFYDKLFFNGTGEIVFPEGVVPVQGPTKSDSKVALVLGAGNHVCVPIIDILYKLLFQNEVCILKMNPINEFMGPYLIMALQPLYDLGVFRVVYGGVQVGKYLCSHKGIDSIHLTGSDKTFDNIVWGTTDKSQIQQMSKPVIDKKVTAELGCITPYIIVPGPWSDDDITYQLKSIVADKFLNSSHNCLAPEILITSKNWELRDRFIEILRDLLQKADQKVAWYPGSSQKQEAFLKNFPQAEQLGKTQSKGKIKTMPWTLATGLSPEQADTKNEKWCGILQEVTIEGTENVEQFLQEAVKFANEGCWGTLSCGLIVHPNTYSENKKAVEQALDTLKYGSISVNAASSYSYIMGNLPWGAFPGNSLKDIGTGNCFVKNSRMYQNLEKGIFRGPFRSPVNFYDPHGTRQIRAMLRYNAFPSFLGLATVLFLIFLKL